MPSSERADRGPLGEPAGPGADRSARGQPGAQRVRGVGLDADGQGDGRVQMQRRPRSPAAGRPARSRSSARCRPTRTTPRPPRAARTSSGQDRTVRSCAGPGPVRLQRLRVGRWPRIRSRIMEVGSRAWWDQPHRGFRQTRSGAVRLRTWVQRYRRCWSSAGLPPRGAWAHAGTGMCTRCAVCP